MTIALRKPMSREEFFRWAEVREGRYEFDGFEPVAMVGGSRNHSTIASNLIGELHLRLRGHRCTPLGADAGIATIDERVRYPDALVTCTSSDGRVRVIPDPVIVFEVLSPSSDRTDRIIKVREYHAVPSIRRYVLVEQEGIGLTVLSRRQDEPWSTAILIDGDTLSLPEIGIEIPVNDLYAGVVFDGTQPELDTPGTAR